MVSAMEAQGLDPATEGAVDAFLNFVVAEGYADEDDRDYLAVLEELVRLTIGQGKNWDAQNALRLLLESGALDGRGFSATTLDCLTGDFNYQWSDDAMGQVESLQQFLAGELENFIEQGLIDEEALPYVSDAMIDQRNVGVLMALYQEALEQISPEERAVYPDYDYFSTTALQFFFASQNMNLYPEDTTPYSEMLLFTMSFFHVLDQVASGIDFFRSLAQGDVAGAILSGLDFVTPGSIRAIGNAIGYSEEALGIIGRNADEAGGIRYAPDERGFSDVASGRRTSSITTSDGSTIDVVVNSQHAFDRPHTIPGTGGQTSAFSRTTLTRDQVEGAILADLSQQIAEGLEIPRRNSAGDLVDSAGNITGNYSGSVILDGMEIGIMRFKR